MDSAVHPLYNRPQNCAVYHIRSCYKIKTHPPPFDITSDLITVICHCHFHGTLPFPPFLQTMKKSIPYMEMCKWNKEKPKYFRYPMTPDYRLKTKNIIIIIINYYYNNYIIYSCEEKREHKKLNIIIYSTSPFPKNTNSIALSMHLSMLNN